MKKLLTLLLIAAIAWVAYALFWPSPFAPQAWAPPAATDRDPAFAANDALSGAEPLARNLAKGPEDVAVDAQGRLYVGYADGTIRRFDANGNDGEVFATTNGRPLGLAFADGPVPKPRPDKDDADPAAAPETAGAASADASPAPAQTLIVADADKGLLAVNGQGDITVLSSAAEDTPFAFTDDVDVADDGQIYFTDASSKYGKNAYRSDLLEHGGHGRLMKYDPVSRQTTVLLGGLQFANGVAVGPDDAYVLVTETGSYRVCRYWLTGENAGQTDTFIDNLPGFPDGISYDEQGRFWLALFAPRNPVLDFTAGMPWLRELIFHLPRALQPDPRHVGHVVGLDENGRVVADMQDASDDAFAPVTSVERVGDTLYLGSLTAPAFARVPVPAAAP